MVYLMALFLALCSCFYFTWSVGINFYCHMDDLLLYVPVKVDYHTSMRKLEKNGSRTTSCLNSEKRVMLDHCWLLHRHHFNQMTVFIQNCVISQYLTAKHFSVMFDPSLPLGSKMKKQDWKTAICKKDIQVSGDRLSLLIIIEFSDAANI